MYNHISADLQTTENFFQKNVTFGAFQNSFKSPFVNDKTMKNIQSLNFKPKNGIFENGCGLLTTKGNPAQYQQPQKLITQFDNAGNESIFEVRDKNKTSQFADPSSKATRITQEEEQIPIIPNILSESLEILSRVMENRKGFGPNPTNVKAAQEFELENKQHNNSQVDIDLQFVGHMSSLEESPRQKRRICERLTFSKQIAITYVPIKYANRCFKRTYQFSKFHQPSQEKDEALSSKSIFSNSPCNEDNQLKDCMVNSTENFVRLHEIDLFMKRKEIRIERSDELLQANEKLLAGHLIVKEDLEKAKKEIERLKIYYQSKNQQVQRELAQEKQSKKQLAVEKELKQSIIRNIKTLNEQYLRENNDLKEKIKNYIKIIHELKYELTSKRTVEVQEPKYTEFSVKQQNQSNKTIYFPLPTINSLPSNNQLTDRKPEAGKGRKKTTFQEEAYEDTSIGNLQERKGSSTKLNNCHSYNRLKGINERKLSNNDIIVEKMISKAYKNTKSQKSIGIKRNNASRCDSEANNNLVFIDKDTANHNLTQKLGQDQHNRSISSYSNVSGISLTHKIGYIPKAPQEKKLGVILDYMASEQTDFEKQNSKQQRFKYKRQAL